MPNPPETFESISKEWRDALYDRREKVQIANKAIAREHAAMENLKRFINDDRNKLEVLNA